MDEAAGSEPSAPRRRGLLPGHASFFLSTNQNVPQACPTTETRLFFPLHQSNRPVGVASLCRYNPEAAGSNPGISFFRHVDGGGGRGHRQVSGEILGTSRGCPQKCDAVTASSFHLRTPPGSALPFQASAAASPSSLSARCSPPPPLRRTQRRQAPPAAALGRGRHPDLQRAGRRRRRRRDPFGGALGDEDALGDTPDPGGAPKSRRERHDLQRDDGGGARGWRLSPSFVAPWRCLDALRDPSLHQGWRPFLD